MKIVVITFGDPQSGSTKYRIMQYESFLQSKGISLEYIQKGDFQESFLPSIREADLVINQKSLLPLRLARKILKASKRTIFDFDDAIYTRPGRPYSWLTDQRVRRRLKVWLRGAGMVTAANQFLKEYALQETNKVEVLPMTLDLELWKPDKKIPSETMTMGWAGAPANLHHIERLDGVLCHLLAKNPKLRLSIYSGKRPKLSCPFAFTPFQDGSEASFIQKLDIGLLPLTDEEFSRGKSPIKAIQYLACAVPVVANVWGATAEILTRENSIWVSREEDWAEAVQTLIDSPAAAARLGCKGREHATLYHNKTAAQERLWQLITQASASL